MANDSKNYPETSAELAEILKLDQNSSPEKPEKTNDSTPESVEYSSSPENLPIIEVEAEPKKSTETAQIPVDLPIIEEIPQIPEQAEQKIPYLRKNF